MREILRARDGYVYTNGEIYGKLIFLAIGEDKNNYYEITVEEFQKKIEEEREKQEVR